MVCLDFGISRTRHVRSPSCTSEAVYKHKYTTSVCSGNIRYMLDKHSLHTENTERLGCVSKLIILKDIEYVGKM